MRKCEYCDKELKSSIMTPFGQLKKKENRYPRFHTKCLKKHIQELELEVKGIKPK